MAENVQITPGVGVSIGADNVIDGTLGNAQIQYVKIMDGSIGGTNKAGVTPNGLAVDGSGVVQPVSLLSVPLPTGAATEATLASVETNTDNLDVLLSTRATELTLLGIKAQTDDLTFVASRLLVDGSGVTQPISAVALPLPTGAATEATLLDIETNTDNLDVALSTRASELTLVGIKGQTDQLTFISSRLIVDGSGVTQPISGTIAATQSGIWSVGRTWALTSGTDSIASVQSGIWSTRLQDGAGTPVTSTLVSGKQALDVNIAGGVTIDVNLDHATDSVAIWGTDGVVDRKILTSVTGAIQVDIQNFPVTTAVTQSTSPWIVSGSVGRTWTLASGTDSVASVQSGIWSIGVNNGVGAAAVNIQDGGNSITVDGTVNIGGSVAVTGPLTDTQLRASAVPVSLASTAITGTVAVTQATSPWVVSLTSTTITGSVAVTGPLTDTQLRATPVPVSGTVTANAGTGNFTVVQATGTNLHAVIDSGSITVANATLAVTQSGTWTTGRTWTLASGTDSVASVQSGNWSTRLQDGTGTPITSTLVSGKQALDVNIAGGVTIDVNLDHTSDSVAIWGTDGVVDRKILTNAAGAAQVSVLNFPATTAVTQSTSPWVVSLASTTITGTVAVTQSTSPWVVSLASTTITGSVAVTGPLTDTQLRASAVPVSLASTTITGTVAVTQSTSPWVVSLASTTITGSVAVTGPLTDTQLRATPVPVSLTSTTITGSVAVTGPLTDTQLRATPVPISGTVTITDGSGPITVDGTVAATQSGVWTTGRTWTLASGTDSVAAVQSGTWNINNISGTISLPTGAATETTLSTRLADATFTARINTLGQKTMANSTPVVLASDQTAIPASQSGTWNINNISGTVSLPTGAATSALQTTGNTSLSTIAGAILAQGSTTSGQSGNLMLGAVTTAAPAYTTAQSSPLSLTTAGSLRVDSASWLGSTAPTVGQKTMANSVPIVISSDQTAIPVTLPTSTTGTSANIARSNANQTFIASNTARKGATVFNDSGSPVFVKLGATASATSFTLVVASQAYFEVPFNYTGIIDGIWGSNGAGAVRVTELT